MTAPKYRASFRRDPRGGHWFTIVDADGKVIRESWIVGKHYDAATAAEAEMRCLEELPPTHDLGGESG